MCDEVKVSKRPSWKYMDEALGIAPLTYFARSENSRTEMFCRRSHWNSFHVYMLYIFVDPVCIDILPSPVERLLPRQYDHVCVCVQFDAVEARLSQLSPNP